MILLTRVSPSLFYRVPLDTETATFRVAVLVAAGMYSSEREYPTQEAFQILYITYLRSRL